MSNCEHQWTQEKYPSELSKWCNHCGQSRLLIECDKAKKEIDRAYADGARAMKFEMLRIAAALTYNGELWPELMLRLREASVEAD